MIYEKQTLTCSDADIKHSFNCFFIDSPAVMNDTFIRRKPGTLVNTSVVGKPDKYSGYCPQFTRTGVCPRGSSCKYAKHDRNHVAICKYYLSGTCSKSSCPLSHISTPHNAPVCSYFLAGNCTNNACKYLHIKPSLPGFICREFAFNGYCEQGALCGRVHSFDCPDFFETGKCPRSNCHLRHRRPVEKDLNVPTSDQTIVDTHELTKGMFDEPEDSDDEDEGNMNDLAQDSRSNIPEQQKQEQNDEELDDDFIEV